jgi:endo-1,4-beta-xylanase
MNPFALSAVLSVSLIASQARAQGTLAEAAAKAGLNIGIATNSFNVTGSNTAYQTVAKTQFNMVVCENEMKVQPTEPSRGVFSYAKGDQVYDFAKANNMTMRGHTLLWHSQSGWVQNFNGSRTEMLGILKTHIDSVAGHFKKKILEWDVLNEITNLGGNSLRTSFWLNRVGEDFPDSALVYAKRVIGDDGFLYYNDFGAEGLNAKSNFIYNLAKRLKQSKIPLDGIGLQCHLERGLNAKDISANIKRLGELGLRVSMTEIDIKNGTSQDWTNLMNACLENYNCVAFVTWGLGDANSWIGRDCDCLLYDGQMQPKPHVQALITALGKADPAVAKQRMEFAARTGTTVRITGQASARGYAAPNAGTFRVPFFFPLGTGAAIDALGRPAPAIRITSPEK